MGEKLVGAMRAGRVAAALGAVVVLGGLVAGCGSSGAEDPAADAPNAQGPETSTSAAPGTASATPSLTPDETPTASPADPSAAAPESGAASPAADQNRVLLESAMSGGDPALCSFAKDGTEGAMAIRGDDSFRFEGTSEKGPIQMVRDGATLYIWQPGATQDLSMDATAQPDDAQPVSPSGLEADVDSLRCERYTGTADAFGVPGGVNFIPLDALPGGAQN